VAALRSASREDVSWYYGEIADLFASLRPGPLAEELGRRTSELDRLIADGELQLSLTL
jgi:hypothetical protein